MFFITTLLYNTKNDKVTAYCWGAYPTQDVAEGVIYRDRGDLHDFCYPYLVIEEMEEDITNAPIKEIAWYHFEETMLEWKPCERPSTLAHIANFALNR